MSARPDAPGALARLSAAGLPGDAASHAWRRTALASLASVGLPTPRDDAWKYTNLRLLERRELAPAATAVVSTDLLSNLPAATAPRLVYVDGRYHAALSSASLPPGVSRSVVHPSAPAESAASPPVEERLRLLNAALSEGLDVIAVTRTDATARLEIVHVATGGGAYPRVRIDCAPGAALELLEYHVGPAKADAVVVAIGDAGLAAQSRLVVTTVQLSGDRTVLLQDLRVAIANDASFEHRLVALGGQLSRLDLTTSLEGAGASARLSGLLFADATREQHVRTLVDHRAAHGTSDQLYRGVAAGRGRGSYDGKVIVREGAAKTSSRQSSRNLLLSPDAAIDTRPQLEINADDVKCAHGATTGTLDETMLFYLLTRGLDRDTARALLTYAFVEDVLRLLGDGPVRAAVEARALARLPAAATIREFVS